MSLAEDLRRDFPTLYPAKLHWAMLSAPEGWRELLYELSRRICDKNVSVRQVKEKFGGLCFYCGGASRGVLDAIDDAEASSWITCDVCGAPGKLRCRDDEWLMVRCEEHGEKAPVVPAPDDREAAFRKLKSHGLEVSKAGMTAVLRLENMGYRVGPETEGGCVAVRRLGNDGDCAWVDVGYTVRIGGLGPLYYDVIEALEGREKRDYVEQRLREDS